MDKTEFGKLLIGLRRRDNMTQSDLANALGVSVSAVSKWETGKNYPDIPVFAELRSLFHLSYDDLYHPEQTLSALEQGTLVPLEDRPQYVSTDTAAAQKRSRKKFLLPAFVLIIFLCIGTLFTILRYSSQNKSPDGASSVFQIYTSGLSVDEATHQEVYEIVLIYTGSSNLTKEIWYEEFYRRSENWWSENPDSSVKCLKIKAYQTQGSADRQSDTDYIGYSYRYIKLK